MATYLLMPGFWLGESAWARVAEPLRADGHEVVALTPAGDADATIESRVADVVAELRQRRDVVLVGHSGAGPVVAAAAEQARERVARVVFVDTGPLPEGVSHLDFVCAEAREWISGQLDANHGWYAMPERARLESWGASAAGLDTETFDRVRAASNPEPSGTVTGSARRSAPDPSLPKTVVACTFTEASVREAAGAGMAPFAEMVAPEWSFVALPTGHWPMFSAPRELAEVLAELS
jgi:pimeloyl-ACP methyl ester carboxylesterase